MNLSGVGDSIADRLTTRISDKTFEWRDATSPPTFWKLHARAGPDFALTHSVPHEWRFSLKNLIPTRLAKHKTSDYFSL